ncbi:MAG TPA: hypothetical protein VGC10_02555 [Sphingomonas sp.]
MTFPTHALSEASIKSGKDGARRWLEPPLWALAALAALVWLVRYTAKHGLHLASPPYWANFFDQSRYIASAQAFAHGDLSAGAHWYPLAYPLLAAPFIRIIPQEPFFLPDLALFVATMLTFATTMRRLGVSTFAASLLFLLGDMPIRGISKLWTEPWTTSLSAPLLWGLIALMLSIVEPPAGRAPPRPRAMFMLGLLAGALPLVRPTDGLTGTIAILFAITMLWRHGRLRMAGLGWLVLGGLVLCAPYLLLHLLIYGPHASEYARAAANQGFAFADLPWKAYVLLITASPWFPGSPSLVEAMPWIIPGLAGLGIVWWKGDSRARLALTLIALLAVPYSATFLAYTDLQPPGLWKFSNAHYFKWLFPLLTVGFWLWLRDLSSWRGAARAIMALAIVLIPCLVRPMPLAVHDNVPARLLMFRGATDRQWNEAYFSPATITDRQGSMINVGRFHQVPDDHGERAVAVSRLFVGPAVRDDPEEAAPYRIAQKPYGRYAVRLSLGIPCWVRQQAACRIPPPAPGT